MNLIRRSHPKYVLDRRQDCVATVELGEPFVVETHDCRTGTITRADQVEELRETRFINPATGPIAIAGVAEGDTICVQIDTLLIDSRVGLMITRPGTTAITVADGAHLRIATCEDGIADVGQFRVPIEPMIGLIGVAPATDPVSTFYGGEHGGNMDTRLVGRGSRVYLRSFAHGAMLYFGDVHAAMGDGEVFLSGVEIAGRLQARVFLLDHDVNIPTPLVETDDAIAVIASGTTLEEAADKVLDKAINLLMHAGLAMLDAGFLMSAGGHLRISQYLPRSRLVHCRFEIPKSLLALNAIDLRLYPGTRGAST